MLGDVFIPVLEMVSEAPPTSSLSDADLTQIADFLVHLSAPQEPNVRTHAMGNSGKCLAIYCDDISQEDSVHDSLAMSVANAVLSEPDNSLLARVYCRSLTRMQLTASNQVYIPSPSLLSASLRVIMYILNVHVGLSALSYRHISLSGPCSSSTYQCVCPCTE